MIKIGLKNSEANIQIMVRSLINSKSTFSFFFSKYFCIVSFQAAPLFMNLANDQKSKQSFDATTELSSELEEVYEQFSKWLDDPILKDNVKNLDSRDEAVLKFASSLLKRTLSESFVGVPLTDGCLASSCKFSSFNINLIIVILNTIKY